MNEQHTPGPWTTDTGGDVTRTDGATLLTREKPTDCTLDESFANARLAAAAPALLEALLVARDYAAYAQAEAADVALMDAAIARAVAHDG